MVSISVPRAHHPLQLGTKLLEATTSGRRHGRLAVNDATLDNVHPILTWTVKPSRKSLFRRPFQACPSR